MNENAADPAQPFVRRFADAVGYDQDEPGEASFSYLLCKDELPGLQIGLVDLQGPIHKTPAAHDTWEQAYLILEGSGTVHLAGEAQRVEAPALVAIPKHASHSVELVEGERLKYAYINQYR